MPTFVGKCESHFYTRNQISIKNYVHIGQLECNTFSAISHSYKQAKNISFAVSISSSRYLDYIEIQIVVPQHFSRVAVICSSIITLSLLSILW